MTVGYTYYKKICAECGRRILVEIFVNGSSHNVAVIAICADCITIPFNQKFEEEYPEATKDIIDWINEGERKMIVNGKPNPDDMTQPQPEQPEKEEDKKGGGGEDT